ncbi:MULTISPECIES: tyrosine--tRNA ligase [unclassified Exiguobacterium]|uniref:tyrosine--tRNA ligase n=2 Tax=Exiguobacterium TaxID=33986 RepID=UPI000ED79EF4|nr:MULTISPECIES: tyrosine--tRNA ligase [unclassified Exiguobacterium]MDT0172469.1 tyrosine--tRNA ligase [Exiguobacterium sp. BRG2]HAL01435.1 tyrosine--tRNA ligase [Exiguobacterium sp.]
MTLLEDLEFRGLINQMTDEEGLKTLLENPTTLYTGFDPTADSLHIGHLLPILVLKRFQQAGHHVVGLVGGATGMIGDPSGRATERSLNTSDIVEEFANRIKDQLSRFLPLEGENPVTIANNLDWTKDLTIIDFLRDIGKHFPVSYMLAKDSVDSRLQNGISFTEFSYMLLQSFDFLKLYEDKGCRLQVGGSDQWGNITAGMELIRRAGHEEKAFGLTVPLVTKADGQKFGKTAGGAVWLDADKTSPYEFYQFWFNVDDLDVIKFLKYFTFLTHEELDALAEEVKAAPEKRVAQRRLAEEMTVLVHGEEGLTQAQRITTALFSGDIKSLQVEDIEDAFKGMPRFTLGEAKNLVDVLVEAKISPSKRQAREDVTNGAIYLNGEREQDLTKEITESDAIGRFTIVRRGKKKYFVVEHA